MKYFKKIEGERIYLSPINSEDVEKYVYWMNDRTVTDNIARTTAITTFESEKEWLASTSKREAKLAIVKKDTDELIGNCSLMDIDRLNRKCTLGIFIGDEGNRSMGYGTEALKLLLDFAFNFQNMHSVDLKVFSFNERAIKCYEKLGFKRCGTRHDAYFLNGKYHDEIEMEMLESDYYERNNI